MMTPRELSYTQLLRLLRGIEILEQIGTQEARKVIAQLAEGTTRPAREAKAALQRLRSRVVQGK